jgi:hypothetical protein
LRKLESADLVPVGPVLGVLAQQQGIFSGCPFVAVQDGIEIVLEPLTALASVPRAKLGRDFLPVILSECLNKPDQLEVLFLAELPLDDFGSH